MSINENLEMTLFVSTASRASEVCLRKMVNVINKLPITIVRLDTSESRQIAMNGTNFQIRVVPSMVVIYNDGNLQLFVGIDKILKMVSGMIRAMNMPKKQEQNNHGPTNNHPTGMELFVSPQMRYADQYLEQTRRKSHANHDVKYDRNHHMIYNNQNNDEEDDNVTVINEDDQDQNNVVYQQEENNYEEEEVVVSKPKRGRKKKVIFKEPIQEVKEIEHDEENRKSSENTKSKVSKTMRGIMDEALKLQKQAQSTNAFAPVIDDEEEDL